MNTINKEKDKKQLTIAFIVAGITAIIIAITLLIFFIIGVKSQIDEYKVHQYDYDCATPYYNNYDSIQFY